MNGELQLLTTKEFDGVRLDCYRDNGEDDASNEFWATREQIGLALGYENPSDAIRFIHNRNKERLDKFSTPFKLNHVEGSRTVTREVIMYNFKGLLEICRYSQQPNANNVIDVLWEIADEIRRTGSYSVKAQEADIELKRHELNLRGAQILQSMIDKELFPLTPETRTVFAHEVFKLVTGHSYLGMLPESSEKWYTATEIGNIVGLSAKKVGSLAKLYGLKAPEGESNEFGRWIFSKSKYSSREVTSFIYSEAGLDWFRNYQQES